MPLQPVEFDLTDFAWESLADLSPEVFFHPTSGGAQENRVMTARPIVASLVGTSGSATLATTNTILPSGTGYIVRVSWLVGSVVVPGARNWENFPRPVFVLPGVTNLAETIGREVRNDMVAVDEGPVGPEIYAGFYMDESTGDLYQREG